MQDRMRREQNELKTMAQLINKACKENKIQLPIMKEGFMKLCKALDMHCTETLAFEGLIYCRGK